MSEHILAKHSEKTNNMWVKAIYHSNFGNYDINYTWEGKKEYAGLFNGCGWEIKDDPEAPIRDSITISYTLKPLKGNTEVVSKEQLKLIKKEIKLKILGALVDIDLPENLDLFIDSGILYDEI